MYTYNEGCVFNSLDDIKGKNITVMGLGLNGGGLATVRFFLKYGAFVTVTDMKTEEQLASSIDALSKDEEACKSRLKYVLGCHRLEDFENADCVIKNPGIKIEGNKYLAAARAIETDISIFLHFSKAPIIAVTGSKGKSSTVSALHYGLNKAGFTCFLGGNITVSPLSFLEQTNENTPVVLELSSWQLADLRGRKALKPFIAIITKIVPDHLNWYGNMYDYIADKRLIYADQTKDDYTIIDYDGDEMGSSPCDCIDGKSGYDEHKTWGNLFAAETKGTVLRYTRGAVLENAFGVYQENGDAGFEGKVILEGEKTPVTILKNLAVPGEHAKINVLNAALVMYLMKVPPEHIITIMGDWQGVAHRLQFFYTYKNVRFFNDSCATVPEASSAASQAFGKPVILITGGTDKGLSFDVLVKTLSAKGSDAVAPKALYFLSGTGTDKVIPELDKNGVNYYGPYSNLDGLLFDLKKNLELKKEIFENGDDEIVVFSPGTTSFGMFANEFDRGNQFMDRVKAIFH